MHAGSVIVVVVPAFEEAPRIGRVLRGMPEMVDHVVVVDDASTDGTSAAAKAVGDPRVRVLRHPRNCGVGRAIVTGYRAAMELSAAPGDAFVVMAGDGQMWPGDLPQLVLPIARGEAGYVKGDRFRDPATFRAMPKSRIAGGFILSWLTSRAIGVRISDSQCGYTALSREACAALDLDALWPGYGYPNNLLGQLARRGVRIAEVPVRAVYADEVSRLRARHVPTIAGLVGRAWVKRLAMGVNPVGGR